MGWNFARPPVDEHLDSVADDDLLRNISDGCTDCFALLRHRYFRQVFSVSFRIIRDKAETEDRQNLRFVCQTPVKPEALWFSDAKFSKFLVRWIEKEVELRGNDRTWHLQPGQNTFGDPRVTDRSGCLGSWVSAPVVWQCGFADFSNQLRIDGNRNRNVVLEQLI